MARARWALLPLALASYLAYSSGVDLKALVQAAALEIEAAEHAMAAYMACTVLGVLALVPTTAMEFAGGFLFVPSYGLRRDREAMSRKTIAYKHIICIYSIYITLFYQMLLLDLLNIKIYIKTEL